MGLRQIYGQRVRIAERGNEDKGKLLAMNRDWQEDYQKRPFDPGVWEKLQTQIVQIFGGTDSIIASRTWRLLVGRAPEGTKLRCQKFFWREKG